MPKISIIVPIYNAEKVLKRCVDSILNQSYKDFELIVINDGSKDKSIKIINEYKEKDNRVKKYFDLDRKSIDTYGDLVEEIKSTFSELHDISEVCGQCDFKKLCDKVLPKNI